MESFHRRPLAYEFNGIIDGMNLRSGGIANRVFTRFGFMCERLAASKAAVFFPVAEGFGDYLSGAYGVDPGKIKVIPNGVDTSECVRVTDDGLLGVLRDDLGIPGKSPVVGFLGNVAQWQGVGFLLDAAPDILKSFPETVFLVMGEGAALKLKAQAN